MNTALYRRRCNTLRAMTETRLATIAAGGTARDLRDACRYVIDGGGKRIRSTLVMLSCQAVGGKASQALDAAVAVELMHNFTLVHDDIMDRADARRGRPTVHQRWNPATALLVGDVLLGTAYERLMMTQGGAHRDLARVFTRGLLEVCDGQALDVAFERRTDVSVQEYFGMIEKKTGFLIATATELGGLIGSGTSHQVAALRGFGLRLGRAFQIQDDLLDVLADPRDFGKTVGGDILEGKRTFLLLTAAERATGKDRGVIRRVLSARGNRPTWKTAGGRITTAGRATVRAVTDIYERYGVIDDARLLVRRNTEEALLRLGHLPRSAAQRTLRWLAEELVTRSS